MGDGHTRLGGRRTHPASALQDSFVKGRPGAGGEVLVISNEQTST